MILQVSYVQAKHLHISHKKVIWKGLWLLNFERLPCFYTAKSRDEVNFFVLHPGKLTLWTSKSPDWKGKSSEPNLHYCFPAVNFPGCMYSSLKPHLFLGQWNQHGIANQGQNCDFSNDKVEESLPNEETLGWLSTGWVEKPTKILRTKACEPRKKTLLLSIILLIV